MNYDKRAGTNAHTGCDGEDFLIMGYDKRAETPAHPGCGGKDELSIPLMEK